MNGHAPAGLVNVPRRGVNLSVHQGRARATLWALARVEWPTLAVFGATLAGWALVLGLAGHQPLVAVPLLALLLALHSSLSHELLHGHPFGSVRASTALGLVQPGLFIPYLRFRRLHLAHHQDARLTDPYDDPESNYLDPLAWARLPRWRRILLECNNTLLGRMTLGPAIGLWRFVAGDVRAWWRGDPHVARDWALHLPGAALVLWAVAASPLSLLAYGLACYGALSILRIRTFLEHRAHDHPAARSVIIEDRGLLAFLFLNNNLHVVHHMHPGVAWYRLPALYRARRDRYLRRNGGYVYPSYGAVFRAFLLRAKDPVAHPGWRDGA